jgi:hypothetical protein
MAREIKNTNEYAAKLLKLIPSEIIAAYLVIEGIVSTQPGIQNLVLTVSSIFLLVLIPFYFWFVFNVKNILQIIITMISFVVWIFSIGGPFLKYPWYLQAYGAVVLILWTLTVPLFNYQLNEEARNENND